MNNLLLIDGLGLLFRSFYATPYMTNANGENIGGVHGFIYQIHKMIHDINPQYVVVAFDTGKKTWRHAQFSEYKINRKPSPVELHHQFQWARDICVAIDILPVSIDGYEADDIIASYSKKYQTDMNIIIASIDKDLMQLINRKVKLYNPFKKIYVNTDDVFTKLNVYPDQIVDYLALIGDSSDGVIGVKGVGPKTASNWLNQYNTLDNIINNIHYLKPIRLAKVLSDNLNQLKESRALIELKHDLSIPELPDSFKYSLKKVKSFCNDFGMTNTYNMISNTLYRI